MMSIRNSGRFMRLGTEVKSVVDDTKLTDSTPSGSNELERTLVTVTPAANQYIVIDQITGEVSGDVILAPGTSTTFFLSAKVIGLDSSPVTLATKTLSNGTGHSVTALHCTANSFESGTRDLAFTAPLGTAVSVEFYLRFSTSGGAPTAICLRNTRVFYRLLTKTRRT